MTLLASRSAVVVFPPIILFSFFVKNRYVLKEYDAGLAGAAAGHDHGEEDDEGYEGEEHAADGADGEGEPEYLFLAVNQERGQSEDGGENGQRYRDDLVVVCPDETAVALGHPVVLVGLYARTKLRWRSGILLYSLTM